MKKETKLLQIKEGLFCQKADFLIQKLEEKELPYVDLTLDLASITLTDNEDIILFEKDAQTYYHPVLILETAIAALAEYERNSEKKYLDLAKKYMDQLIKIGQKSKNALLFAYPFDFALHGLKNRGDLLEAPWYSGMAQGEALTVLVRLYRLTVQDKYLESAEQVFNSFYLIKGKDKPYISEIDSRKFFWIEEYPSESSCKALNGFIFALYGLYEYFMVTKKAQAKDLLEACLTTIYENLESYRNQGDLSFYCLGHGKLSETYHKVHIKQLKMLYKITGESYFQEMAKKFEKDYLPKPNIFLKISRLIKRNMRKFGGGGTND